MRRLITSDIHGSFDEFCELLEKSEYNIKNDQLIILGDICDRNTKSKQVFEKVVELQKTGNVIFLLGNHEIMIKDYLEYGDQTYSYNGGYDTLLSFDYDVEDFVKWIKKQKYFHEDEDFIYLHAGLNVDIPLHEQTMDEVLWIREGWIDKPNTFKKTVIFGHTPTAFILNDNSFTKPLFYDNKIAIDTAGVYGGKFTMLIIDEDKNISYVQVNKKPNEIIKKG